MVSLDRRITRKGPQSDPDGPIAANVDLCYLNLQHRLSWLQFLRSPRVI